MIEDSFSLAKKVTNATSQGGFFISKIALLFMVAIVCYHVCIRYILNVPANWSEEINNLLLISITWLGVSQLYRKEQHIHFNIFIKRLPITVRRFIELLVTLFEFGMSCVVLWKFASIALQCYRYDFRLSSTLATPLVVPYLISMIGFSLLTCEILKKLFRIGYAIICTNKEDTL